MNKKQTIIVTNHLINNIPKLTQPVFRKLDLDNPMRVQDRHKYQNLNCLILAEIIKFLASNIEGD